MLYLFKGLSTIPGRQNTRVHFFIFIVPTPPCTLTAVIVGGFREEVALVMALKKGVDFTRQRRTRDGREQCEESVGTGGSVVVFGERRAWNFIRKVLGRRRWTQF